MFSYFYRQIRLDKRSLRGQYSPNVEDYAMATATYSSENLDSFFVMAADKGLMNKNTAVAIRNATSKVLGVLEDHERVDVRSIDRDRVFQRFQNLYGMKYSPESLATYRSRFTTGLDEFITYASDPSAYKPQGRKSAASKKASKGSAVRAKKPAAKAGGTGKVNLDTTPTLISPSSESLMIPIPIRDGALVRVFGIPTDLTIDEANKITAVVKAYATQQTTTSVE